MPACMLCESPLSYKRRSLVAGCLILRSGACAGGGWARGALRAGERRCSARWRSCNGASQAMAVAKARRLPLACLGRRADRCRVNVRLFCGCPAAWEQAPKRLVCVSITFWMIRTTLCHVNPPLTSPQPCAGAEVAEGASLDGGTPRSSRGDRGAKRSKGDKEKKDKRKKERKRERQCALTAVADFDFFL